VAEHDRNVDVPRCLTHRDAGLGDFPFVGELDHFEDHGRLQAGNPVHPAQPQRNAIIYGALYEGLASDPEDADARLSDGRIILAATHDHGCVGSAAGIYTASMPVFVVENANRGNRAYSATSMRASRGTG
jgi:Protein of unknown function (DUF1116)